VLWSLVRVKITLYWMCIYKKEIIDVSHWTCDIRVTCHTYWLCLQKKVLFQTSNAEQLLWSRSNQIDFPEKVFARFLQLVVTVDSTEDVCVWMDVIGCVKKSNHSLALSQFELLTVFNIIIIRH